MIRQLLQVLASWAVRRAVGRSAGNVASRASGGRLDIRLGMRLLRDKRVPLMLKVQALALGGMAAMLLQVAEIPFESLLLVVMPLLGIADVAFDGAEILTAVWLVASLALPFLVPESLLKPGKQDEHGRVYDAVNAEIR